jgi:hypothetical protein
MICKVCNRPLATDEQIEQEADAASMDDFHSGRFSSTPPEKLPFCLEVHEDGCTCHPWKIWTEHQSYCELSKQLQREMQIKTGQSIRWDKKRIQK